MFRFGYESVLSGYVLVPLLGVFFWYVWRLRRRAVERFGDVELIRKLSESTNARGQAAKMALMLVAVTVLVTALARPQFGTRVETVTREGQDIVVALDVSASMLAEDITPNRLEKAKNAIRQLIENLDGDRIALVAFAGEAFVQSPLTADYAPATMFLNAMEPDLIPVQGTNLGEALRVSLDAFEAGQEQHRVLIVITDGEDHEGAIDQAVENAAEQGIRVYAVGVGSPDGVPIPDVDDRGRRVGYKRDENGDVVTTSLDEATLERIASATGGRYYRATARESELEGLADEIAGMAGRQFEARQTTQFEEQYQIFLGLGLALLLIELLIPERRRVREEWVGRFT
jgi:Ca-activated chloride channel family protein